jgi:hypothetical protein
VTAKSRSPASSSLDKRSVTLRFLTDLDPSLCVLSVRNEQPVKRGGSANITSDGQEPEES